MNGETIARRPVCDAWIGDSRCRRLSVAAFALPGHGERAACPDHAPPGAERFCTVCRQPNASRDPFACRSCRATGKDTRQDRR